MLITVEKQKVINLYMLNTQQKLNQTAIQNQVSVMQSELPSCINHKRKTKRVGNYSYNQSDVLGTGYTSKVYLGFQKINEEEKPVAIKQISLKNIDAVHHSLLKNQTKIVKKLSSPFVVQVYDVLLSKNNCYIVMQLCEEGTLENHLKKKICEDEKIQIIDMLINGFKYLVKSGIIHRDIKPANILLGTDGIWKIADFGFSINSSQQIDKKINVGSPLYMSPEASIHNDYSFLSDCFAYGLVFYQIIHNGKLPRRQKICRKNKTQKLNELDIEKISTKKLKFGSLIEFQESFQFNMDMIRDMLHDDPNQRIHPLQLNVQYIFKRKDPESPSTNSSESQVQKFSEGDPVLLYDHTQSSILKSQEDFVKYKEILPLNVSKIIPLINLLSRIRQSSYFTNSYNLQYQTQRTFINMLQKHIQLFQAFIENIDNTISNLYFVDIMSKKFCFKLLELVDELISQFSKKLQNKIWRNVPATPNRQPIKISFQIRTYYIKASDVTLGDQSSNWSQSHQPQITKQLKDSLSNYKDFLSILLNSKSRNDMKLTNILSVLSFRQKIQSARQLEQGLVTSK